MSYAALMNNSKVPQSRPLDASQVRNNAGGFVYSIDGWARLDRFLILGSDANTYYESARKLTRESASVVVECWKDDARRTADVIRSVSVGRRAPKNSPAIFAVALGSLSDDPAVRTIARGLVGDVCRTASHLFEYVATVTGLGGGWGRGFRRSVSDWYGALPVDRLGFQMTKYRSRNGFDHSRLLHVAHPSGNGDAARIALYRWARGNDHDLGDLPEIVTAHIDAMTTSDENHLVRLIEKHRLTWEAIPTDALKSAKVWRALLPNLGLTALLRNLPALAEHGVTKDLSDETRFAVERLTKAEDVRKAGVHPFAVLQALAVYKGGKSFKGDRRWKPVGEILNALDEAFYLAFDNVEATGKRHYLGLDVSGSMGTSLMGSGLSAREGSVAMAMATARAEKRTAFGAFTGTFTPLDITAKERLDEVVRKTSALPFGRTDCAQPMLHALKTGLEVDAFVIYTDNETWAGAIHPTEALRKYRRETGIPAKLCVVAMTPTRFSIAGPGPTGMVDPADGGMMDFVGFDTSSPSVMADFVRG